MNAESAASPQETNIESHDAFDQALHGLAAELPELADAEEQISDYGAELITDLGIRPELFEEKAHTVFFAALAQRSAGLEDRRPGMSVADYMAEKEFITDAVLLLARDKSDYYDQTKDLINSEEDEHPNEKSVYDRYTNVQVSQELQEAIDTGGLLDAVKSRLSITADTEDEFEVRVLNVASDYALSGMRPAAPPELEGKPYNAPEWQAWDADKQASAQYHADMKQKGDAFAKELGFGELGLAWATTIDDKKTLVVPLPVAEKIMYRNEGRASYYAEDAWERDFAILEHEYTHTQGGLNLDSGVVYGIGAEELRAEHFSGDKNGYMDIKGFFIDLRIVTGLDVKPYFDRQPKGGDAGEFYTMVAQELGLQNTLELALTTPKGYVSDSRKLQQHAAQHLGGLDGLTERLYNQALEDPGRTEKMDERLERAAQIGAKGSSFEGWAAYRKDSLDLKFITEKIEERVARTRTQEKIAA
ncbi:MAG TPA: hypothetical protein VK694_01810 [Verrucomicrobiae bacterium]|nr:hypothetical protein [Verrucomicrobiae bacterium]